MRAGRLILFLVVAGVGFWLYKNNAATNLQSDSSSTAPIDRARTAAAKSNARNDDTAATQSAADAAPASGVTENMTPDQVRALLGAPSDISTETTASGAPREIWTYKDVNKTVVFENGIAVSVR